MDTGLRQIHWKMKKRYMEGQNCISPSAAGRYEEVSSSFLMDGDSVREVRVDVVFCVTACNGEGRYHPGGFELAKIPYVGCGVLSSAVSMDKLYTKIIVDDLGSPPGSIRGSVQGTACAYGIGGGTGGEVIFPIPVFIKPSMQGLPPGAC